MAETESPNNGVKVMGPPERRKQILLSLDINAVCKSKKEPLFSKVNKKKRQLP